MKAHTAAFKKQIKEMGREIDSIITYGDTALGNEKLNAVTPSFQGAILKSVMKQLEIDSNIIIPVGATLNYKLGVKVNGDYEYINFGNYIVKTIEKQEDTLSYKITCYDKILFTMRDYVKMPVNYPINVRDYINSICTFLGLSFKNKNDTFANYDKIIQKELYLDDEGNSLGYTFRDVLDELAQVTASTICINENDEVEIRYINDTNDTIDEEFLKDINVNFGEKYGPVNIITLSRSAESDNIYYPEELPNKPVEIKIVDNQIMNFNDRSDYLPDIYTKLNGLEFYINDFSSTGITYYDLCDRYNVKIADKIYSCIMFNDEINVTQGLEENVFAEMPKEAQTDYTKADKTDRRVNQVYIIVNKQEKKINALVSDFSDLKSNVAEVEISSEQITSSVSEINSSIDTIRGAIEEINSTMLTQTAEQFEMLFKQTGIKDLVDQVDKLTNNNNSQLNEFQQWIRFKNGNIELGRSDSQVKLLIQNDKIVFKTGESESAYITNNQLYITDSTILKRLRVGHWVTEEDEQGRLNERWVD